MQENHIDFTEESNAIDYLEKAYYFLTLVKQNPINWKWVILALHGALYGFAICTLQGVRPELVYRGINLQQTIDGVDSQKKQPKKKLMLESLDGALHKCQDSQIMSMLICGRPLVLTTSQKASIKEMTKGLRNPFVHYIPKLWIILTERLPHISNDVLDVISFLATKTGTNPHVAQERHKIEGLIHKCKTVLKEIN